MPTEDATKIPKEQIESIIATDCGSTTTKAILIEKTDGEYRLIVRGEAPTTVEAPFEDVTMGVRNAVTEVEELSGKNFLSDEGIIRPRASDTEGVDIYLSTSSAGGGLQMMVAGVVKTMTAESAERAALGAGAIVMDAVAVDDGRMPHEKISRIRQLRPDMILLSGGVDGGTIAHVSQIAELIAAADPRPRLGIGFRLPVIFAGNKDAREYVKDTLGERLDLRVVDNIRPVLEEEVLAPAREEIHNLFMEHVMAQAPGYNKLMQWTDAPIMPTPGAVGLGIQNVAEQYDMEVVGVDIGGATTDIFSVFSGTFNRTVSANLGMSYSISNVLLETGIENISRWLPMDVEEDSLRNRIRNKMIRPTTIPQTLEDLVVEQALAREALRLAFEHHKTLATGLKGIRQARDMGHTFDQTVSGASLVNMMTLGMILGSGGVLSHAPRRVQAALMLLDAFQPEGVTRLAVDSIFMMPQLGVLATVHPEASAQVFDRDCLVRLGSSIAPIPQEGVKLANLRDTIPVEVTFTMPDGSERTEKVGFGELRLVELEEGTTAKAHIEPGRRWDVGAGVGRAVDVELEGGVVGIVIDGRSRPIHLEEDAATRHKKTMEWIEALNAYPMDALKKYIDEGRAV
ncbi:MAG: glutamate mutase L [Bacillota bacterium]